MKLDQLIGGTSTNERKENYHVKYKTSKNPDYIRNRQVGSKTIEFLSSNKDLEIVAAVRSPEKAAPFIAKGIATIILDFDDESTHLPAFEGIDRVFIMTGYPSATVWNHDLHGSGYSHRAAHRARSNQSQR